MPHHPLHAGKQSKKNKRKKKKVICGLKALFLLCFHGLCQAPLPAFPSLDATCTAADFWLFFPSEHPAELPRGWEEEMGWAKIGVAARMSEGGGLEPCAAGPASGCEAQGSVSPSSLLFGAQTKPRLWICARVALAGGQRAPPGGTRSSGALTVCPDADTAAGSIKHTTFVPLVLSSFPARVSPLITWLQSWVRF